MMIVRASQNFQWLEDRIGGPMTKAAKAIEAVDAEGHIRGMVGFDLITPNSTMLHMALDWRGALKYLIPAAKEYVFRQLGLTHMFAWIASSHARTCRLAEHIGFKLVSQIEEYYTPRIGVNIYRYDSRGVL